MSELIESDKVFGWVSTDVEDFEVNYIIEEIIPEMITVLQKVNGVGITAVQIGIPKKVSIYYWNGLNIIFNSHYYKSSSSRYKVYEGCLSYKQGEESFLVKRYKDIIVVYDVWNSEESKLVRQRRKVKGVEAQILQHEIDHQHGIVIF